jgi:hypothetical protein
MFSSIQNSRQLTKYRNSVIHHRQNPLDSMKDECYSAQIIILLNPFLMQQCGQFGIALKKN